MTICLLISLFTPLTAIMTTGGCREDTHILPPSYLEVYLKDYSKSEASLRFSPPLELDSPSLSKKVDRNAFFPRAGDKTSPTPKVVDRYLGFNARRMRGLSNCII